MLASIHGHPYPYQKLHGSLSEISNAHRWCHEVSSAALRRLCNTGRCEQLSTLSDAPVDVALDLFQLIKGHLACSKRSVAGWSRSSQSQMTQIVLHHYTCSSHMATQLVHLAQTQRQYMRYMTAIHCSNLNVWPLAYAGCQDIVDAS